MNASFPYADGSWFSLPTMKQAKLQVMVLVFDFAKLFSSNVDLTPST